MWPDPVRTLTYQYVVPGSPQPERVYEDYTHRLWLHPDEAPAARVEPGRYDLTLPDARGSMRVDVYPEGSIIVSFGQRMPGGITGILRGDLLVTRPGGSGERSTEGVDVIASVSGSVASLFQRGFGTAVLPLNGSTRTAW